MREPFRRRVHAQQEGVPLERADLERFRKKAVQACKHCKSNDAHRERALQHGGPLRGVGRAERDRRRVQGDPRGQVLHPRRSVRACGSFARNACLRRASRGASLPSHPLLPSPPPPWPPQTRTIAGARWMFLSARAGVLRRPSNLSHSHTSLPLCSLALYPTPTPTLSPPPPRGAGQQRLIYRGRVLKDEMTLESYGTSSARGGGGGRAAGIPSTGWHCCCFPCACFGVFHGCSM